MNNFHLLSLNQFILVPIWSDWMYDIDLCCLDTAVCNQSLRDKFLIELSKCNAHAKNSTENVHTALDWYLLRHVGKKELYFNYLESTSTALSDKLESVLKRTKHLSVLHIGYQCDTISSLERLSLTANKVVVDCWSTEIAKYLSKLSFTSLVISGIIYEANSAELVSVSSSVTELSVDRYIDIFAFPLYATLVSPRVSVSFAECRMRMIVRLLLGVHRLS